MQPNPTYSNSFYLGSSHNDNSPPPLAINTSLFGNSQDSDGQRVGVFCRGQDTLNPIGAGNIKPCIKLRAPNPEGGISPLQTCSFNIIPAYTLSRALSQTKCLNIQDSPIKSVNTITEPLHISENGLSRLLQSMDMTQASNPNALRRKRSKNNSSSGRDKFAAGEPQPKASLPRNSYPMLEYEEGRESQDKAHVEHRDGMRWATNSSFQNQGEKLLLRG